MATGSREHGFQALGRLELREALDSEIRAAEQQLNEAPDAEERMHAQEKLDALRQERDDVDAHGAEWLF